MQIFCLHFLTPLLPQRLKNVMCPLINAHDFNVLLQLHGMKAKLINYDYCSNYIIKGLYGSNNYRNRRNEFIVTTKVSTKACSRLGGFSRKTRTSVANEERSLQSRPSVARIYVEYNCWKTPLDHVWIVVKNRNIGVVIGRYAQHVKFSKMLDNCDHCCHVGHSQSVCLVMGNKLVFGKLKPIGSKKQTNDHLRVLIRGKNGGNYDEMPKEKEPTIIVEKGKEMMWMELVK
ncbi:Uncharacterized protein TCM_010045 [Theobroma cacao]|uniref:Uncharacterized protein n=1 Tax=Theobroma cacao TaxID=3641 RepID=A0A061EDA6_THECC|nr:Uncharacterized protein TCM_010045 [Theobroma cacao]